jgi:hypothetical protein
VRRKISADVDGGLSGVSRCADTGARTPIGVSGNSSLILSSIKLAGIQWITLCPGTSRWMDRKHYAFNY